MTDQKPLSLDDVPSPEAEWSAIERFATTFDGYEVLGPKACAEIAEARLARNLEDLRACLFYEQRRWRHAGTAPPPEEMNYIRGLLAQMRRRLMLAAGSPAWAWSGAILSDCKQYRYALWRGWDSSKPRLLILGLNPSTADATEDDPTLRRCVGFARASGHGELALANLFAWRATDPTELESATDPIGPDNDAWLARLGEQATTVVAAWGNGGVLRGRGEAVAALFDDLLCLGVTKSGQPRHPLYVSAETEFRSYPSVD